MVNVLLSALRWAGVFGLNLGGGGGGKQPANTTQTVINDVAPWAREAAKETLAKGMELTNQGYESYGGERLAGYDPLQEQSYQGAQDMTTASQLDEATRLATQSGNYNPADFQNRYQSVGESWNPNAVQQYMSPYMEAALNPQLRAAARDAQLAQIADQAAAVGRGAFGGSRTAIGQGMREQGLMQNLGDIRAKGYQTAYEQAAQQFQADQARKVQEASLMAQYGLSADQAREQSRQFGSTAGLNAAAQLGILGQTQFQQGMDINKLRNTYGAQKQAQDQKAKDLAYENWAAQKNWDYEQVMRAADLLNRVPSGSSSTTSMYKAGPSTAQQVAAVGTTAAGASQLFAHGGLAYADGGVTGDENVASIVSSLSTEQLQQALTIAQQTGDPERIRIIAEELQSRGGEEAIPPNSISATASPDMVSNIMPTQQSMANGGIVAFNGDEESLVVGPQQLESAGIPDQYRNVAASTADALARFRGLKVPTAMSDAERRAAIKADYEELQSMAGSDPYAAMQEKLTAREGKLAERRKQDKGLALLAAVPELLQGSNFAEAAGRGIGAAAKAYQGSTAKSDEQANALQEAQFLLADAKRKERMGDIKGARESVKAAEAARLAAYNAERTTSLNEVMAGSRLATALRPIGSGKGAGAGKTDKLPEQLGAAEIAAAESPTPENIRKRDALRTAVAATKDMGPLRAQAEQARLNVTADAATMAVLKGKRLTDPQWLDAFSRQDSEAMRVAEQRIVDEIKAMQTPAPVKDNSTTMRKADKVPSNAPSGSTLGDLVTQGRYAGMTEVKLNGKLIGHTK